MPEQGIIVYGGKPGDLKTYLALYTSCCISTGRDFLNEFETKKRCKVVYIDEENNPRLMKKRLRKLIVGMGFEEDMSLVYINNEAHKINLVLSGTINKKKWAEFVSIIEIHRPKVVIIDSLTRFMIGNEDRVEEVRRIFDNIKPLMEKFSCSFIFLHHAKKGSKGVDPLDVIRGSGDFTGMADNVFRIRKENSEDNLYRFEQVKSRDGTPIYPIGIKVIDTKDEQGILIELREIQKDSKSKTTSALVSCIEDIKSWLVNNKKIEFKRKELFTLFKEDDAHTTSTIKRALKKMIEDKVLVDTTKYGGYKVIGSNSSNVEPSKVAKDVWL
ncbi:MAG: AAA family ATPase [archaeon]